MAFPDNLQAFSYTNNSSLTSSNGAAAAAAASTSSKRVIETRSLKSSKEGVTVSTTRATINELAKLSLGSSSEQIQHVSVTKKVYIISNNESRLWTKLYLNKIKAEFSSSDNPVELKNAIMLQFQAFLSKLESASSESAPLVAQFINDLKNKSLEEISQKYFEHPWADGTLPFISDLAESFKREGAKLYHVETDVLKAQIANESLKPGAMNRDGLMRILAYTKKAKHPQLECYVVDQNEFKDIMAYASLLKSKKQDCRFQILVRSDVHYTAVDIEIKGGAMRTAVMDAAGDESSIALANHLKSIGADEIYILGRLDQIQYDRYNCSFFSLDTVVKSSQVPNFFDLLRSKTAEVKEGVNMVAWKDLPPRFVKNATSTTFMKKYYSTNPDSETKEYKKSRTFKEFIDSNIEDRPVNSEMRPMNVTIEKKIGRYAQITHKTLDTLSNQQVTAIVKHYALSQFMHNHPCQM